MAEKTRQQTTPRLYRGAADAGSPNLAGLPGVHRTEADPAQVQVVQRHDTDDHRLAAARVVVTTHHDGEGPDAAARWEVELPDGSKRERLRIPVAEGADPAAVPADVLELAQGLTRGRPIGPVGRVRTTRQVTRLHGTDDRLLVTVTHDEVSVATFGRSTEVRAWSEARVEAHEPARELIDGVETRLAETRMTPGVSAADAELDRLLRPTRRRGKVGPKGSAGAALVDYLAVHIERLGAEDLRVRRDEPDSVHQLRVASRRLRSALQAYRPLLDRERTDPIVEGLRQLGQALAPARDAEVLAERITGQLAALPDELRLGGVQAFVTRHFARTGQESRAAVLTTLDSEEYATLRAALDRLLDEPPLTRAARGPAAKVLPQNVRKVARRLSRAMEIAVDPAQPAQDRDLAVHDARKAGKRLRYATEVARPVVGTPAKRFAKQLKGLQEALGEHQDTVVARDALRELGAAAHVEGENGFSFGLLHGRDAATAERIERDLPQLFADAWRAKARRWIA